MRVKELCKFIAEREKVRLAKEAGRKKYYWTTDNILSTYRFCNVHREDDRVTKWIAENWRGPHSDDPHLWFAMVVARLLNLPESLAAHGYPVPYRPGHFMRVLGARRDAGLKNFNGAYIVSTNGRSGDKLVYLNEHVLQPLWKNKQYIRPIEGDTLESFHTRLMAYQGMGSFMAAQVVADLKYVEPLKSAPDWECFAASGPGSRRGLNRIIESHVDAPWNETAWREQLAHLQRQVNAAQPLQLHAQDLQNCLCEFDKYERVRLGEGTPKQLYKERT